MWFLLPETRDPACVHVAIKGVFLTQVKGKATQDCRVDIHSLAILPAFSWLFRERGVNYFVLSFGAAYRPLQDHTAHLGLERLIHQHCLHPTKLLILDERRVNGGLTLLTAPLTSRAMPS